MMGQLNYLTTRKTSPSARNKRGRSMIKNKGINLQAVKREDQFFFYVPQCPRCRGAWARYDGALGYQSLICKRCGLDIGDIKPTVDAHEGDDLATYSQTFAEVLNLLREVAAVMPDDEGGISLNPQDVQRINAVLEKYKGIDAPDSDEKRARIAANLRRQIAWLEDFCKRWESWEDGAQDQATEAALCDEIEKFCKAEGLQHRSADENKARPVHTLDAETTHSGAEVKFSIECDVETALLIGALLKDRVKK